MVKSGTSCVESSTTRNKSWPYYEYYRGERDDEERRNGQGENHWTSAESIEYYTGNFILNTMHGSGDYRWRFKGEDGAFYTYEGQFYANTMHGYGTMSYPDGRVFTGIFYNNKRFGPGVEHTLSLRSNVGLWYDNKLVRLTWVPAAPSIIPDFCSGQSGPAFVEPFRKILCKRKKIIGQINNAIELMKQCGADPMTASANWMKLYPKFCTDLQSKLCYVDAFDHYYYNGKISTLEMLNEAEEKHDSEPDSEVDEDATTTNFFAWNNSDLMIQMMQHCYKHETQRAATRLHLSEILNGPRKRYRPSDKYEKDCRTLLMASYLGHIINVARLVNDCNVFSDVADAQGNTALMYAVAGDQPDIIHFLVEAGANIDAYNDSCCTALGIALMRYLCAKRNIVPNAMVHCLIPQATKPTPATPKIASEWFKSRISLPATDDKDKRSILGRTPSKVGRTGSNTRKMSITSTIKKKPDTQVKASNDKEYDSDESFSEDKRLYTTINNEYVARVNEIMSAPNAFGISYLFESYDMNKEVLLMDETLNPTSKQNEKLARKSATKSGKMQSKEGVKGVNEVIQDKTSTNSMDKLREEALAKIMLTIIQLLIDGADPKLVVCPQPALLMAVLSGSPDLVRHLIRYGADLNMRYADSFYYTPLDVAISRPLSLENVEVIRALLENGADTKHRLYYTETDPVTGYPIECPGPTLIHAVLAKHAEFQFEEDIRNQIIELLLSHNCDPTVQFKGRSAIEIAMTKKMDLIDIFMKNPSVNLNAIINMNNQTILVKMFDINYFRSTMEMDRFPILTNLLLHGADPLLECRNGEKVYGNVFAFANKVLIDITPVDFNPVSMGKTAKNSKAAKDTKVPKVKSKGKDIKGKGKGSKNDMKDKSKVKPGIAKLSDEILAYQEAIDLMRECARLLHIRWLQSKLMKELIDVIYKFKHRPWSMIFKEHRAPQSCGIWLATNRCLEIWDILKSTRKKLYTDDRILRHLLCIVQFYNKRLKAATPFTIPITALEKNTIESDVSCLITEHRIASKLAQEAEAMKKIYVKPELAPRHDKRFNVCFECALPIVLNKPDPVEEVIISPKEMEKQKSKSQTQKSKLEVEQSKMEAEKSKTFDKSKMEIDKSKSGVKSKFGFAINIDDEDDLLFKNMVNFLCPMCELVRFCNAECLRKNVERVNCHPCSEYLKAEYFPIPMGAESTNSSF